MNASLAPLPLASLLLAAALLGSGCDTVRPDPQDDDDDDIHPPVESVNTIDSYPAWGPDGRTIAYTHWPQTPEEAEHGPDMQIWLLDVETGARRFLTPGGSPPGARTGSGSPSWGAC